MAKPVRAVFCELVARHRSEAQFGLFGDARVNVLTLNLALDARQR